eukprot:1951382-Pyramimonas_sp.AAC.1
MQQYGAHVAPEFVRDIMATVAPGDAAQRADHKRRAADPQKRSANVATLDAWAKERHFHLDSATAPPANLKRCV